MASKGLRQFISVLEKEGELVRVDSLVSPVLEITEIVDRLSKNHGPAILFTNNGTDFPLLINSMGSEKRMCMALGLDNLEEVQGEIGALAREFMSPRKHFLDKIRLLPSLRNVASWMPKTVSGRGICQEVVMDRPDLSRLPVLTCWPADGGPFITLPCVHTRDPETGQRNLGMYRMQVFGPDLTGMHWHLHKGSAHHFRKYQEERKRNEPKDQLRLVYGSTAGKQEKTIRTQRRTPSRASPASRPSPARRGRRRSAPCRPARDG